MKVWFVAQLKTKFLFSSLFWMYSWLCFWTRCLHVTCYASAVVTCVLRSSTPSGWPLWRHSVMSVCYRSPHSTWSDTRKKLLDLCALRLVVISCASALLCPTRMPQLSVLCQREASAVSISSKTPQQLLLSAFQTVVVDRYQTSHCFHSLIHFIMSARACEIFFFLLCFKW